MALEIRPSEIDFVDSIGDLDGEKVKLVKTKGGLYIAVGKPRGKHKEEVIAAGSHPAIVRFNIEKSFSSFQPAMMKSESGDESLVAEAANLLPEDMRSDDYSLYVIKKSQEVEIVLTKSQIEVLGYQATLNGSDLVVSRPKQVVTKELLPTIPAISLLTAMVAADEGKQGVVVNGKRYTTEQILKKS